VTVCVALSIAEVRVSPEPVPPAVAPVVALKSAASGEGTIASAPVPVVPVELLGTDVTASVTVPEPDDVDTGSVELLVGDPPVVAASLLVVPFWAFWHLPLFFATESYRAMGIGGAAGWLASLVSGSLLTSWLTDRARGSILPAAVLHAVLDIYFLADVGAPIQSVLGAAVTIAGVAVAVILARPQRAATRA